MWDYHGDLCLVCGLGHLVHIELRAQESQAIISFLILGHQHVNILQNSTILLIAVTQVAAILRGWTLPSNPNFSAQASSVCSNGMLAYVCCGPGRAVTHTHGWGRLSTLARMCCPFIPQTFTEHPSPPAPPQAT